jgi:restriction endonuclease S subunit
MKYQTYPAYKDSGVECLGALPEHWVVQSLSIATKRISVGLATSVTDYYRDTGIPIIRNMNIKEGYFDDSDMLYLDEKFAASQETKCVYGGDVIAVHTGSNVGLACVVPEKYNNCHTFTTLVVTTGDDLLNRYLTYCINSQYGKAEVNRLKFGFGKDNLNVKEFRSFYTILPQYEEQQKIAQFLDHETAKIDTLIEKQQRLIELLKEKRQAVISHAVTKGLNPNAPMKESGVEWLGNVPEGWEVKRLKFIVSAPLMYGANEAAIDTNVEHPRFVRITDVDVDGSLREDTFRSLNEELAKFFMLAEGDVLLARSGGTVGKSFIYANSWGRCCFAGYLIKASIRQNNVLAEWFYQFTQTQYYWEWIASNQIQATIQNVSADKYNNFFLTVPPMAEQQEIINNLETSTNRLNDLIFKAETAIELMQERRTALISAAVTGKIDVRDWGD